MARGPIAIAETLTLPAQPASGTLTRLNLGGDGFRAPIAAYSLEAMTLTGDVSGGSLRFLINMDARFCTLMAYSAFAIAQGSKSNADFRYILGGDTVPGQQLTGTTTAINLTVHGTNNGFTWYPKPFVLPGGGQNSNLQLDVLNVDDDVVAMNGIFYLFDIRVRELTPMGPLLWAAGAI